MSKRHRGGKPKQKGERFPCGKLRPAIDKGSERVVELHARFASFQGGKGDQWCGTPIGRAWLVGLLDGFEVDSAAIRDAGLGYAERYWGYYPAPSSVANYEGQDRRGKSMGPGPDGYNPADPRGEKFQALELAVRSAGRASGDAVHSLCIDHHWFPDENPAWLDRLINAKLAIAGKSVVGKLPLLDGRDHRMLNLAVAGLLTIVAGKQRRAA